MDTVSRKDWTRLHDGRAAQQHRGYCNGKGGSMHIADVDAGMLGANGIVGAGPPIATGAALTADQKDEDRVALAFFGDGAVAQGQVHGRSTSRRRGTFPPSS